VAQFPRRDLPSGSYCSNARDLADEPRGELLEGRVSVSQNILVAEDDEGVRHLIRRSLEQAGYDVSEVANGAEAIRAAHATAFDLVITDILMPETDGLETIVHLRKRSPGLRVIAISGYENALFLADARGLGATRVLTKPFKTADLLALVQEVLGQPTPV
jgi:CheY-like chemotaxis protein